MRDKVTGQCPQTTTFEEKGEPKRIRTEVPLLTSQTEVPLLTSQTEVPLLTSQTEVPPSVWLVSRGTSVPLLTSVTLTPYRWATPAHSRSSAIYRWKRVTGRASFIVYSPPPPALPPPPPILTPRVAELLELRLIHTVNRTEKSITCSLCGDRRPTPTHPQQT